MIIIYNNLQSDLFVRKTPVSLNWDFQQNYMNCKRNVRFRWCILIRYYILIYFCKSV